MLRRYSHKPRKQVVRYLSTLDAYTLHKPTRIRFPRRRTISKGIADLFQIDLVDLSNLSTYNDGYRYLLNCIDVFTKRAWSLPLRTKTGRDVSDAFERILTEQRCNMVQSDKGTEFLNSRFQSMLRRYDVKFYTSENEDIRPAVVKRFNRTLKQKMYRILPQSALDVTLTFYQILYTLTITPIIVLLAWHRWKLRQTTRTSCANDSALRNRRR